MIVNNIVVQDSKTFDLITPNFHRKGQRTSLDFHCNLVFFETIFLQCCFAVQNHTNVNAQGG